MKPRALKFTKILMVRSSSYLENGFFINIGIMGRFYMTYFNPTIDFNMLQYISSSDSQVAVDLPAGLLMDFNDLIIPDRSKYTMHAILQDVKDDL